VCRLHKSSSHISCSSFAGYSKNSMGYYYGVRLHMITDINGLPLTLGFTTTKVGEREWLRVRVNSVFKDCGLLFVGDKGYQGIDFKQDILDSGNYILTGIKQSKNNKTTASTMAITTIQTQS
jgi:hypothetical protein